MINESATYKSLSVTYQWQSLIFYGLISIESATAQLTVNI